MSNYIGYLAMFSIAWTIAMVISMVRSEMLHDKVPRRDKGHTYSGGSLKGETEWMFRDSQGRAYVLGSERKPMTTIECFGIIFMWVFLPVATVHYVVFKRSMSLTLLTPLSILLWTSPFICSILSRVDVVINFN